MIQLDLQGGIDLGSTSQASWSPNGENVLFTTNGNVYTTNANGTNLINLNVSAGLGLGGLGSQINAEWIPNGKVLFSNSNGDLYVINSDGSNFLYIPNVNAYYYVSPSGNQIAFQYYDSDQGGSYFYTSNLVTGSTQKVNQSALTNGSLNGWFPDETKLLLTQGYGENMIIDLDGSGTIRDFTTVRFDLGFPNTGVSGFDFSKPSINQQAFAGGITSLTVLANDLNPGGGTLTITHLNGQAVDVGDIIEMPSGIGSISLNADYTISYNAHSASLTEKQNDSFTYTLSDAFGNTSTATVEVAIMGVNAPPVLQNQFFETNENQNLQINTSSFLIGATDKEGHELKFHHLTQPAHGIITLSSDGKTATYQPNQYYNNNGQNGSNDAGGTQYDSFTYTITDGKGGYTTATATINIIPVNSSPTATNDTIDKSLFREGGSIYIQQTGADDPNTPTIEGKIYLGSGIDQQFSPDYNQVAFLGNNNEIWIVNSDGSGLTQITDSAGNVEGDFAWSPDNQKIYFTEVNGTNSNVWVIDISSGISSQLTTNNSSQFISVSNDGQYFAFGSSSGISSSYKGEYLQYFTSEALATVSIANTNGSGIPQEIINNANNYSTLTYTSSGHLEKTGLLYFDGWTETGYQITSEIKTSFFIPGGWYGLISTKNLGTVSQFDYNGNFLGSQGYLSYSNDSSPFNQVNQVISYEALSSQALSIDNTSSQGISIYTLANDTDPDNNDILTISSVSSPSFGSVQIVAGTLGNPQHLLYIPDGSTTGNTQFTYTIIDEFGLTSTATVTVYVF